jgi:hypothetical protein
VPTYAEIFACGTVAGTVNSFVVAPVELVRNRQVVLKARFRGPGDIIREILATEGVRGLWRVGGWVS